MIRLEGAAGEYAAQRLRVSPGTSQVNPDPDITESILTGVPPGSGAQVICWRQFGTCLWTSPGVGWNDDGTPLRCSIRGATRSGTGHDRAGPSRHRWCSRRSVGSPTGPLMPLTGPLAFASTVVPTSGQSLGRGRVSGSGSFLVPKPRSIPITRNHGKSVTNRTLWMVNRAPYRQSRSSPRARATTPEIIEESLSGPRIASCGNVTEALALCS